jgi:hypothetical protein
MLIKWLKRLFAKPIELPTKPIYRPLELTLRRVYSGNDCTIGILTHEGNVLASTLELPYLNNQLRISSIPTGRYKCIHHDGDRFKDCWRLLDTAPRTAILIHSGNTAKDIEGCILVGERTGKLQGKKAVLNSRKALNDLKEFIGRNNELKLNEFYLNIVNEKD